MIEDAVEVTIELGAVRALREAGALLDGLEDQVRLARLRIVRAIAKRIAEDHGVVAAPDVDEDGDAGREVDDVERIVRRVVLVAFHSIGDRVDVDRGLAWIGAGGALERDGDGGGDTPAFHRREVLPGAPLHVGRRDQAHVHADARAARRIGERRDVVRERHLGQRAARGVELHLRAGSGRRAPETVGCGVDLACNDEPEPETEEEEGEDGPHPGPP